MPLTYNRVGICIFAKYSGNIFFIMLIPSTYNGIDKCHIEGRLQKYIFSVTDAEIKARPSICPWHVLFPSASNNPSTFLWVIKNGGFQAFCRKRKYIM